jgi:hypothetical protein
LLVLIAGGCGHADRGSPSNRIGVGALPVAARYVQALWIQGNCRRAAGMRADRDPTKACFEIEDANGSHAHRGAPIRHSGRLSRPCKFQKGPFALPKARLEEGCVLFELISRRPNKSMSTGSRPAYTYAAGTLAVFLARQGQRWVVEQTAYHGSGCAGPPSACAAAEHEWNQRARATAPLSELLRDG